MRLSAATAHFILLPANAITYTSRHCCSQRLKISRALSRSLVALKLALASLIATCPRHRFLIIYRLPLTHDLPASVTPLAPLPGTCLCSVCYKGEVGPVLCTCDTTTSPRDIHYLGRSRQSHKREPTLTLSNSGHQSVRLRTRHYLPLSLRTGRSVHPSTWVLPTTSTSTPSASMAARTARHTLPTMTRSSVV